MPEIALDDPIRESYLAVIADLDRRRLDMERQISIKQGELAGFDIAIAKFKKLAQGDK